MPLLVPYTIGAIYTLFWRNNCLKKNCHFLALKSEGGFENWKNIDKNGILQQRVQYFTSRFFKLHFYKKHCRCASFAQYQVFYTLIQKIAVISIRGKMLKNCIEEERKVYTSHFKTEFGNKYQQYVPFSVVRRNTGSHCLQLFNHNWLNTEQSEQALSNSNCFASVNKMEEAQPHNYVKVGNFWRLIFKINQSN